MFIILTPSLFWFCASITNWNNPICIIHAQSNCHNVLRGCFLSLPPFSPPALSSNQPRRVTEQESNCTQQRLVTSFCVQNTHQSSSWMTERLILLSRKPVRPKMGHFWTESGQNDCHKWSPLTKDDFVPTLCYQMVWLGP